ncbi:MAG: hypothetical protein PHS44_05285, partial [Candidatus Dojkabacteria bacterium]|nr:hypothetical protein [Candidatus Dojkabacteria bacterium]
NLVNSEDHIRNLLQAIETTGNKEIWMEHINLSGNKLKRIIEVLKKKAPGQIRFFEKAKSAEYKLELNRMLFRILADFNFKIGGGGIFDHVRKTIIVRDKKAKKRIAKTDWRFEMVE